MAINVVLENPQLTVLGPPAQLDLNINSGEKGNRGSYIYSGTGNPNNSTLLTDKILGDLFIRTDIGEDLGYLYQYSSVPGGEEWLPIINLNSVSSSIFFFAQSASVSANSALNSSFSASSSFVNFDNKYLGSKESAPSVNNYGETLEIGSLYFNNAFASLFVWNGSEWSDITTSASATFQASLLIPKSILNNPGDIVIAQSNDTPTIFSVGPNNSVLISSSSASTGLAWSNNFSTIEQVSSASATAAALALVYANSASSNAANVALAYANSASSNAALVALEYANSASSNAANVALAYANSASSNASLVALEYANSASSHVNTLSQQYAEYTSEWNIGSDGSSAYNFTGPGFVNTSTNNPTFYLIKGQKYKFIKNTSSHPFRIQNEPNGSVGTQYNDGIVNNDLLEGTLTWNVQFDAPSVLYYQCTAHSSMGGEIYITDSPIPIDLENTSKNQVLVYNGEKWNNENYILPLFFGGM